MPGYGYLWQPYGVNFGWNPYMNRLLVLFTILRIHVGFSLSLGLDAVQVR